MPRRRSISCDYCGSLQLKRDTECESCGRMTRRERKLWTLKAVQIGLVLIVVLVFYSRIKGFAA